jgi:type II secretory pathway pseudopilin PulG
MQRKGNILMKLQNAKMRNGFSMITAIFVILIMASVGAFVMNLSGKIVKSTTTQYQHEQAILYAKSYTEYAVMAITGNNRSNDCLEDITNTIEGNFNQGSGYRVRAHISYITTTSVDTSQCSASRVLSTTVQTASIPITAIIDVYIDYKDPDNTNITHTVHRRTVQRI